MAHFRSGSFRLTFPNRRQRRLRIISLTLVRPSPRTWLVLKTTTLLASSHSSPNLKFQISISSSRSTARCPVFFSFSFRLQLLEVFQTWLNQACLFVFYHASLTQLTPSIYISSYFVGVRCREIVCVGFGGLSFLSFSSKRWPWRQPKRLRKT